MTPHEPRAAASPRRNLRDTLRTIIFGTDTPGGKAFDVVLLVLILSSIAIVAVDSVEDIHATYGATLFKLELALTGLFTIEYALRIFAAQQRTRYIFSFYGLVDLMSLLPTYLGFAFGSLQSLLVIRVLRLLRVFRVLKLVRLLTEAAELSRALRASLPKITVFLGTVLSVVVIIGTAMHLIEGPAHGFTSIPRSMYWAIVTLTTVGYGDIAPSTPLGQTLASLVMILGYGVLAVPTGIVSVELANVRRENDTICPHCNARGHTEDAHYCRICGNEFL